MPKLNVYCFGRLEIHYKDTDHIDNLTKPPTLKSQSLLAYLILRRQRPSSREKLMGMFWGDRPERKARRSLSNALTHIRHCLPDGNFLQADNQVVQIALPITLWLDAEVFMQEASRHNQASLQTAATLYRGEFMSGFFDDWVIDERYRLQALYMEMLARLMTLYETQGQVQAALTTARRLLTEDNLREDAHRLIMRAYCHLGKRNAALKQYQLCQEAINQELDTEPTNETIALYQSILDGRFQPLPANQVLSANISLPLPATGTGHHPLGIGASKPLVGRQEELAFLSACWSRAQTGTKTSVLVSGEAGVGKTHLIETFAQNVSLQGVRTLWGRCYEFERVLPYQPIAEALRPWLLSLETADQTQLPAWVVAELSWLLPDVMKELEIDNKATEQRPQSFETSDGKQARTRLFHAIAYLLSLIAHRPLLIVLEDLHWATESTLQLIHYLARYLANKPVLLCGTYRQELVTRSHPVTGLAQLLNKENIGETAALSPLSQSDVESLALEMSAAGEAILPLARRLHQETEGNPFFLMEIIKTLFDNDVIALVDGAWRGQFNRISVGQLPLPASIREAVLSRVQRLSEADQAALRLTAVLGREFDFDLFNTTLNQGEEATLTAIDTLLRHRLISEGQGRTERDYLFTHHKIQEVIYANLPARRCQHLHAQVGQVMETLYADQLESYVAELAHHFDHGRQLKRSLKVKAADYLQRAGQQAASQFANTEALTYFNRALNLISKNDLTRQYDLLLNRVRIYNVQGERPYQKDDLESLAATAEALADTQRMAEIAQLEGRYYFTIANYPAAITASQTAVDLAAQCETTDLQARGYQQWGDALSAQGDYTAAQTQLKQATHLAQSAGAYQIEADSLRSLGLVSVYQGEYQRAKTMLEQALAIFRNPQSRSWQGEAQALRTLGNIYRYQGDHTAAQEQYKLALQINQQMGDRYNEAITYNNLGVILWDQSDFGAAEIVLLKCLQISREIDARADEGYVLNNLGRLATERGRLAQAREYLHDALQVQRQIGERQSESMVLQSLAYILREQGAYKEALDHWQKSLDIRREIGDRQGEGYTLRGLVETALIQGEFTQVEQNLSLALSIFTEIGEPKGIGEVQRGLGRMATRLGNYPAAVDHFQQALAYFKTQRQTAYTFLQMSLLYHEMGDDETAVTYGQQALQNAQEQDIRLLWATALTYTGHIHIGLGNLTEAVAVYEQALGMRHETGQHHLALEPVAALAHIQQLEGKSAQALAQIEPLWQQWQEEGFDGAEHTIRTYLLCYEIFQANDDPRAPQIIKTTYQHLQVQANTIPQKTDRRRFLENIPIHRNIIKAYRAV
ncbi:MAG: tetratricopeptide repeat protein [Chloroflexi bacterium]|nr:tetratricopeptide repeat protein [Chloroflexota bacterium]